MPYADYNYYRDEYRGAMASDEYERLSRRASAHLDSLTFGRIEGEWVSDPRVKDACCAVADVLQRCENGGELASETVGKWSRSYATQNRTPAQNIRSAVLLYLGDTGLMYRGVSG